MCVKFLIHLLYFEITGVCLRQINIITTGVEVMTDVGFTSEQYLR
jgi:hypothetical protein